MNARRLARPSRATALLAGALLIALPLRMPANAQAHVHGAQEPAIIPSDLGDIDFPNSGAHAAQGDFLRGVLLLHSFEFNAARTAFLAAQTADPQFALAYWGEALSHNAPIWNQQDLPAARAALAKLGATAAARLAKTPTPREKAYLSAVERLFGEGEKPARDAAYSAALGEMARTYPQDLDARAFYALSLLGLTGAERNVANYMRAAAEAEGVYEINKRHPGALHYLIHAYDDPMHAPLGLRAARLYAATAPAASHAQHMPSHIFFALGMWDDAIRANVDSLRSAREHGYGGYHALIWLMYAYLQEGRRDEAARLVALVEDDVKKKATPDNRLALASARATWIAETNGAGGPGMRAAIDASGVRSIAAFAAFDFTVGAAAASEGDLPTAREALKSLRRRIDANRDARDSASVNRYDNVTPSEVRQSELMANALEGAISVASGDQRRGVALVREAVEGTRKLSFEYGPPWSAKPLAELLGDLLLKTGDRSAAATAFETTLKDHPKRRLSLEGLAQVRGK